MRGCDWIRRLFSERQVAVVEVFDRHGPTFANLEDTDAEDKHVLDVAPVLVGEVGNDFVAKVDFPRPRL